MNPNKAQGTRYEVHVRDRFRNAGWPAERLPEEGINDRGDAEAVLHGDTWIVEAKARQQMQLHSALAKAKRKADGRPALLFWKRLLPVPGKRRRQPVAGVAELVCMTPSDLLLLLEAGRSGPCKSCATTDELAIMPAEGEENDV